MLIRKIINLILCESYTTYYYKKLDFSNDKITGLNKLYIFVFSLRFCFKLNTNKFL